MSKSTPKGPLTAGGRALRDHILSLHMAIPTWCDVVGLTDKRIQIQRIINGERAKRVTVNLAFAIEEATEGAVTAEMFRTERPRRRHKKAA